MEEAEGKCVGVNMWRRDNAQPWGFRMTGGRDLGCCLFIAKVNPRSLSERFGLRAGDIVLRIEQLAANNLSHDHAKAEILRAGNDLHLVVQRGAPPPMGAEEEEVNNRRGVVVEERTEYRGDPNPTSQSHSFNVLNQFLEDELEELSKKESARAYRALNGPRRSRLSEQARVQVSTNVAAKTAPGGTSMAPAKDPPVESVKAASDHPAPAADKESTMDSVVVATEFSQKAVGAAVAQSENKSTVGVKANTATVAPKTEVVDVKANTATVARKTETVDVKANTATVAATTVDIKANTATVAPKTEVVDVKANTATVAPKAESADVKENKATVAPVAKPVDANKSTGAPVTDSVDTKEKKAAPAAEPVDTKPKVNVGPVLQSVADKANRFTAAPAADPVVTKPNKVNVGPVLESVAAKANKFGAAPVAEPAPPKADQPEEAKGSDDSSKAVSVDVADSGSDAAPAAVSVTAEAADAPVILSGDAVADISADAEADISADAEADISVDMPVVVSVDADVSESVEVDAPLTIVEIDGDDVEDDYSEDDYSEGSVSEGSDEEATFTIQLS